MARLLLPSTLQQLCLTESGWLSLAVLVMVVRSLVFGFLTRLQNPGIIHAQMVQLVQGTLPV